VAVCWLHHRTPLHENALIRLPERGRGGHLRQARAQMRYRLLSPV